MGWGGESWTLNVLLDVHAGEKEREHEALWKELKAKLRDVAREPRYAEIVPEWALWTDDED